MIDANRIISVLLERLYQENLFGDLPKFRKGGDGYIACCPFHDDSNPSLSISIDKPLWNCFAGCGGGNWFKYIQRREGCTFYEALEKLARDAGFNMDRTFDEEYKKEKAKQKKLEKDFTRYQTSLFESIGRKALEYLQVRGYKKSEIIKMDLGFNIDNKIHPIYIPDRGVYGELRGFIRHRIDGLKEKKYLYPPGLERNVPINFHKHKGRNELIIVEGIFDALIADANGIEGVIAIGTSLAQLPPLFQLSSVL